MYQPLPMCGTHNTYTHTRHSCTHTVHVHTGGHKFMNTYTHTQTLMHTHSTYTHPDTHAYPQYTCTQVSSCTHTHTIHTCAHIPACTNTHTATHSTSFRSVLGRLLRQDHPALLTPPRTAGAVTMRSKHQLTVSALTLRFTLR